MKYKYNGEIIPAECRDEINKKIEYIVSSNLSENQTGISKEDMFNAYTGIGGLHGLKFCNYDSYYDYQKAKSEIEQGQFFTPYKLVEWIYNCLNISNQDLICDMTCGHGSFVSCAPEESNFYGCELNSKACSVAKYLYPDANIIQGDIRDYNPGVLFDYVVGNPPYNLTWNKDGKKYLSEYFYCIKAAELLKPAGIMAIIVPESFLSDEFSNSGMIQQIEKSYNFLCQIEMNKNSFSHLGVTNYKTKLFILQKKSKMLNDISYSTDIIKNMDASMIWERFLKNPSQKRKEIKNKIFLEIIQDGDNNSNWRYKVEKILYDIKRNPKTCKKYADACEYVRKYRTQKKPDYMQWDEWEKVKITADGVIKHLKDVLRSQNGQKSNGICISREIISAITENTEIPGYKKLLDRKKEAYKLQNTPFYDLKQDKDIKEWLDNFVLSDDETEIRLNDVQKHDLNLFLQKPYNFIQWEQGSGKTLAGIAIGKYRLLFNNVKVVFVVSTAISIKNNWSDVLDQYGINHRIIEKISDIKDIEFGEFVLITLDMLSKLQKWIKRYVKSISQKALLILDESDNISNRTSKRTKAVLNCFRKLRFKTLTTGTSTRNNIAEIYSQIELLYNNSVNMLSESATIIERNKDNELIEKENEYYMRPYPAYNKGYKLFCASHIPEKITVFGVAQYNQDIYNSELLKRIIDKTIITRTFEEITKRDLYEIVQESCKMGIEEEKLYNIAINEFYKLEYLFKKTGNSRKDAMMKILNQLLALLKICAAPQTMKEYDQTVLPEKFKKVIEITNKHSDERVAIGARHISVVKAYETAIRQAFPGRPVFIITGNETSLKQRKKIINDLKNTINGILISTQQSLSASMNIDFVNVCIIPELHWNNSSMSQYYFRFIRYTSKEHKKVYFVTYENSIESNLLKMILMKDKLNMFMKDQDLSDQEIYERFGVNENMLANLMYKEKTEEGYVIKWGNQMVD